MGRAKSTKEERPIKAISAFRTIICKNNISTVVEGCGRDCKLV